MIQAENMKPAVPFSSFCFHKENYEKIYMLFKIKVFNHLKPSEKILKGYNKTPMLFKNKMLSYGVLP